MGVLCVMTNGQSDSHYSLTAAGRSRLLRNSETAFAECLVPIGSICQINLPFNMLLLPVGYGRIYRDGP